MKSRAHCGNSLRKSNWPYAAPSLLPPAGKASHKAPEKQLDRAEVLFDYTGEQSDELSIRVGEILEVVSKEVEEGWWKVGVGCV